MKRKLLKVFFIIGCLSFSSLTSIKAQQNFAPAEIKGSYIQEYQELKIEITGIKRVPDYQRYFGKSTTPRGLKLVAEEGQEIAVVQLHTTRLGKNPGISVYYIYLLDDKNNSYKGFVQTFFIGTGSESRFDPKERDYEFPVQIPKGTKITAVQLQQPVHRDTQPYIVIQKITFYVSVLDL